MSGFARAPNSAAGDRSQSEQIRRLRTRRQGRMPIRGEIGAADINEGFLVEDPYLSYVIAGDRVHWSGNAYWNTPAAYSESADPQDPVDNAINIFSGGTTDAFGGTTYDNALLPAEVRPPRDVRVALRSMPNSGDRGFYDVTYQTLVTTGGAWSIQTVTVGGSVYPVNQDGLTHTVGVAVDQTLWFDGVSWDLI